MYTYRRGSGWETLNLLSTIGALIIAASMVVFVVNVIRSLRHGGRASADPWGGTTLEWLTDSPPPAYGFALIPAVDSRQPLRPGIRTWVTGLPIRTRALLVTRLHDAAPDHVQSDPDASIWPFVSALAVTVLFIGSIFTAWALIWGAIPVTIALIGWFWPNEEEARVEREIEIKPQNETPPMLQAMRPPS